jgi:uncharacterized protein DUF4136
MPRTVRLPARAALALIAWMACYPERGTETTTYDSVVTVRDTSAVFSTANTFALADSVVHLVTPGEGDNITRAYDQQMLDRVRLNMTQAGYTEVLDPATADLNVVVLVTSGTFTGYYWDYWCTYYGWWYGAWGCYYPPYWYTYEFDVGAILIGMADNREIQNNRAPLIWAAGATGLMNTGATLQRIIDAIDQAFTQSPYIQSN